MRFFTTHWTLISEAREGEELAINSFVDRYRPPLLEFLKLQGTGPDAEDLAQEVFLRLVSRDLLKHVDPDKGRFRSYLLAVTRNVLSEHRKRALAQKRGGDRTRVELTDAVAVTEGPSFDACWCRDLLQRGLDALKLEHPRQFQVLELRLLDELPYEEVAVELDRPVEHVRVDLHRARQRLIRLIKGEIARYCCSEEEFREELDSFLTALDRR